MPTWFLPPDFTFKPEKLPLGTIIAHPKDPTDVLAFPPFNVDPSITLPEEDILNEAGHEHFREVERRAGLNLLAKMAERFSALGDVKARRRNLLKHGQVDHEIRNFKTPFKPATLKALVALSEVRDQIDSGMFGRRPVYIVAGLRVAREAFTVTQERETELDVNVRGSGASHIAGLVPVEAAEGRASTRVKTSKVDEYKTHAGIVFAYQVYAIRAVGKGDAARVNIECSNAFMTGEGKAEEQDMEVVDADAIVLEEDVDESTKFEVENIGESDYCITFK